MKNITIFYKIIVLLLILSGCTKGDSDAGVTYSLEDIPYDENVRTIDYDRATKKFLLGYVKDEDSNAYEVRDSNFTLEDSGDLNINFDVLGALLLFNDQIIGSPNYNYHFKTKDNLLVRKSWNNYSHAVGLYDPSNLSFSQTLIGHEYNENIYTFFDSDEYHVFSADDATCYFVNKTTYEVTSFLEYFEENYGYIGSSRAVGEDERGRIIISTSKGVLVYENNEWLTFLDGEMDQGRMPYNEFYLDSKNRLYAVGNVKTIIYDLEKKELLDIQLPRGIRILGEDIDGNLIYMHISYAVVDDKKRLKKLIITEN